jgi:hypothetical protein
MAQKYKPAPGEPPPPSVDLIVSNERAAFSCCTDYALCEADPYGDGDQTPLPSSRSSKHQRFVGAWADGATVNIFLQAPLRLIVDVFKGELGERGVSFARSCAFGNALAVKRAIIAAGEEPGGTLRSLLEARHTPSRVSPLHCVVVGSKLLAMGGGGGLGALPACAAPSGAGSNAPPDHEEVARLLLSAGARPEPRDVRGCTPLHLATSLGWSAESLRVAAVLLRHGARPDARDRSGRVPLLEAAMSASPAADALMPGPHPRGEAALPPARLLLESGADPSLKDADGVSAVTLMGPASALMLPAPLAFMQLISSASRRGRVGAGRTQEGDAVELSGLSTAEMNGRTGVCGAFDPIKGRYSVTLESGEQVAVKADNLGPPGGHAATPLTKCDVCNKSFTQRDHIFVCSRCKKACYCSKECQRAEWKTHKQVCKEFAHESESTEKVFLQAVGGCVFLPPCPWKPPPRSHNPITTTPQPREQAGAAPPRRPHEQQGCRRKTAVEPRRPPQSGGSQGAAARGS